EVVRPDLDVVALREVRCKQRSDGAAADDADPHRRLPPPDVSPGNKAGVRPQPWLEGSGLAAEGADPGRIGDPHGHVRSLTPALSRGVTSSSPRAPSRAGRSPYAGALRRCTVPPRARARR